jgi:SAM-dependent methyltransferase
MESMATGPPDELRSFYQRYDERGRLQRSDGRVEFLRTCEIALDVLPPPPAVVADIGGGPGVYATWLGEHGYSVVLRDVMPFHIEQAQHATQGLDVDSAVADARHLDLADASVDAVLLLGPLYHLPVRGDRVAALAEARRVVCPGGPVIAAAISRWAPFLDGALVQHLYERFPQFPHVLRRVFDDGVGPPLFEGDFTGYFHRPDELRAEIAEGGLELVDLVGLEGLSFALADLDERWDDPQLREAVLDITRRLQRVPELLGLSPHMLATARRPSTV